VSTNLHQALFALPQLGKWGGVNEGELGDAEVLNRANMNSVSDSVDACDIPRAPIGGRDTKVESAPLADGEGIGTIMGTNLVAMFVKNGTWSTPQTRTQETLNIAICHEAQIGRIRFRGKAQTQGARLAANLRFRWNIAKWKHGMSQCLRTRDCQNIRLIFGQVTGSAQHYGPVIRVADAGVMPGADRIESQRLTST
jgi:hypothetical protein